MKYEYHTVFLSVPRQEPQKYMAKNEYEVDGVQFARDIQNTIHEMAGQGFELSQTIPLVSTKYLQITYTEGVTLIFRKMLE